MNNAANQRCPTVINTAGLPENVRDFLQQFHEKAEGDLETALKTYRARKIPVKEDQNG